MNKTLVLISLNELNFDIAKKYLPDEKLNNLEKISKYIYETECNEEYKNLEPWIQWPTIYTGLTAAEHNLFRLGDSVNQNHQTVFNQIEDLGYQVGAISPMNVANNLKNPSYFIPDPWTDTKSDNSFWSNLISETLSYFIKKNSEKKFNPACYFKLALILFRFGKIKNYFMYLKLLFTSFNKNWRKALFLDLLLNDIHLNFLKLKKTKFSNLFLNGIAHIQHHYMFNSKILGRGKKNPNWYIPEDSDPIKESLIVYDKILSDYIKCDNIKLIIATGLTQIPYDRVKYYYKLKNHKSFFEYFEVYFKKIQELMSRDFILHFENKDLSLKAYWKIKDIKDENNKNIFGDIEIKEKSLFISFVCDEEISNQTLSGPNNKKIKLKKFVIFLAIKNGMHSEKGFFYSGDLLIQNKISEKIKLNKVKEHILEYFKK